ncbi:dTDP-4-dehydrorhamnose 3,5-epimerase [Bacteroidota bacterium]
MKFTRLQIPDVFLIEPNIFKDNRGHFFESFSEKAISEFLGESIKFVQDNESFSTRGVLRGLHFQIPPFAQTKLVRVVEGKVLDVAVDIRIGSETFGKYISVVLDSIEKKQLFIPRGFAHGFLVLSESAIFNYKVDNYYSSSHEMAILYNDKEIGIDWESFISDPILSSKDLAASQLKQIVGRITDFSIQNKLY